MGQRLAVTDQVRFFDPGLELLPPEDLNLQLTQLGNADEAAERMVWDADDALERADYDRVRAIAEEMLRGNHGAAPPHFYLSLRHFFAGDSVQATASMRRAAELADDGRRSRGLRSLDRLMIQFPSKFHDLLALARALEHA